MTGDRHKYRGSQWLGDEGSLASHNDNCGLHPDDQEDLVENSELGNAIPFLCKETDLK